MKTLNCLLTTAILMLLTACSDGPTTPQKPDGKLNPSPVHANVIYGRDNRVDLYQEPDPRWVSLASSTSALVQNYKLHPNINGMVDLDESNYGTDMNLCASEPFREQSTAAFCSGFLIDENTMVTAGHCIQNQYSCDQTSFVFGFAIATPGPAPSQFSADEIYKCKSIVHTQAIPGGADFAIVRLDRPVIGHQPLALRQSGSVSVGNELVVIGHPVGLPTKIAKEGFVRSIDNGFVTVSLDTYGGNSGSAVFNALSGEVEGILVRGEADFQFSGSCRISNVCTQNTCRGEDVTTIQSVLAVLNSP